MEKIYAQLIRNISSCSKEAIAMLQPENADHVLSICGTLANSLSLISALMEKNDALQASINTQA